MGNLKLSIFYSIDLFGEIKIMVHEQHQMIVTKEKFLIFRQLRVTDIEATEKFLLYEKSVSHICSYSQAKVKHKIERYCRIDC